ncbi:MAG TPA: hypothetical protein VFY14_15660, partial [Streptomyces sp.]|nr:hypothetical protein [Streptomyces sp.]
MTEHACVVCQHEDRIPHRPPVCEACRARIASHLREIPDLYARLDPTPSQSGGEKVSGSHNAPVPVHVDVLDLLGEARSGSARVPDSRVPKVCRTEPETITTIFDGQIIRQEIRAYEHVRDTDGNPVVVKAGDQTG